MAVPIVYEKTIGLLIMFGPHKEYVFANVTELNERISRTACDHGHQRDVHVQRLDHHQTGSTIVKTFLQDPVHARV